MRRYREVGKTGVSFLTAYASGHTLDQDAVGYGYLLSPGLYINLLLPYNEIGDLRTPITQTIVNPEITPNVVANELNYNSRHFTVGNYPSNQNVLANENLGNPNYSYEVLTYENS